MSSFFGSGTSSTPQAAGDASAQFEQIKQRVKGEIAMQNAQQLMNKLNEKCYLACVTKPSSSLSSSEETCLSRCMQRYMEAYNIVSHTYQVRMSKEAQQRQATLGADTTPTLQ